MDIRVSESVSSTAGLDASIAGGVAQAMPFPRRRAVATTASLRGTASVGADAALVKSAFPASGREGGGSMRAQGWTVPPSGPSVGWPRALETGIGPVPAVQVPMKVGPSASGFLEIHGSARALAAVVGSEPGRPGSPARLSLADAAGRRSDPAASGRSACAAGETASAGDRSFRIEQRGRPEDVRFDAPCPAAVRGRAGAAGGVL